MITVNEAKTIIHSSVKALPPAKAFLSEAFDTILAEDVFAPYDIPAYPQSSMDGYAFSFADLSKQKSFSVAGESAAGNNVPFTISQQTAARIFTGAAVPGGADTVVMQEKIQLQNGRIIINDDRLEEGYNVRKKGSEISKGELALQHGTYLNAAAVGFLANVGITHVNVYAKPRVSVILTGNELKQPGSPLGYGEVYESNSFALSAALMQLHVQSISTFESKDDPSELKRVLQQAMLQSDLILLTGGVSVGDYDFVRATAEACGVQTLFHRIKQRPGKPLYFGVSEGKVVFGLPGNPSSVLACFYEYVVPSIGLLCACGLQTRIVEAPLSAPFSKSIPFTQFLKGFYDGVAVTPLTGQESYKMNSFAKANCLIVLNEADAECKAGEVKEVHLINEVCRIA